MFSIAPYIISLWNGLIAGLAGTPDGVQRVVQLDTPVSCVTVIQTKHYTDTILLTKELSMKKVKKIKKLASAAKPHKKKNDPWTKPKGARQRLA
jgi:hypothetical protein